MTAVLLFIIQAATHNNSLNDWMRERMITILTSRFWHSKRITDELREPPREAIAGKNRKWKFHLWLSFTFLDSNKKTVSRQKENAETCINCIKCLYSLLFIGCGSWENRRVAIPAAQEHRTHLNIRDSFVLFVHTTFALCCWEADDDEEREPNKRVKELTQFL